MKIKIIRKGNCKNLIINKLKKMSKKKIKYKLG